MDLKLDSEDVLQIHRYLALEKERYRRNLQVSLGTGREDVSREAREYVRLSDLLEKLNPYVTASGTTSTTVAKGRT